jgi:hypothetical protein
MAPIDYATAAIFFLDLIGPEPKLETATAQPAKTRFVELLAFPTLS